MLLLNQNCDQMDFNISLCNEKKNYGVVELDDYKCIYDVHKNCFELHWMATLLTAD